MVTTVTRAAMAKTIMQNFLDLMRNNIVPVVLTNPTGGNDTHTIQFYASTFNDKMLSTKTNYPIIIVYPPKLPEGNLTYTDILVDGTITLEIHATNSLATTEFYDQMKELIITNKSALNGVGLYDLKFIEDDADNFPRGGFKDHWMNFNLSFEFQYTDGS